MTLTRGCGSRVPGGVYITVPTGDFGRPLEYFLVDYPLPWNGPVLRSPMIVPDGDGINHMLLGVGRQFYPTAPDYVEEAKKYGVSKRIPKDFPIERLTPGKSKFLLVHNAAIPTKPFLAEYECPKESHNKGDLSCIGALWPLSALEDSSPKHDILPDGGAKECTIKTPSVEYKVRIPEKPKKGRMGYKAGVFLRFQLFQFDFISKTLEVPKEMAERYLGAGFKLEGKVE